jgi:predicted Zn-dependent protease with MMP-like domain
MPQAEPSNIIIFPSPIELLWKKHETAASEKVRVYELFEIATDLTAGGGAAADAAADRAEAAGDAAYDTLENIVDEIIAAKATSVTDLAIKARVLARHGCVEDVGFYRPEDILGFFADVQTFAAL